MAVPHGTSIGNPDHIQEAGSIIVMISNGSKEGREGGLKAGVSEFSPAAALSSANWSLILQNS